MRGWKDRASLVFGRDLTLGALADRLARVHGDRLLVEEPGRPPRSYAESARRVDELATGIARSAGPGDRVVLATANGYDQFLLCLAASRIGAVAVPVNPHMRPDEVQHVVSDSQAALLVRDAADVLVAGGAPPAPGAPADPGAVAALFYTSGTTGKPKGVRLTHRALLGQAAAASLWPARLRRDEAVAALPVAHIMGFVVLAALACGGIPVYLMPRFRAGEVLDAIEQRRTTIFIGVPAMYRMLIEAGAEARDLRSVRVWISGADVMPAELARRFQALGAAATLPLLHRSVGGAAFIEGYGMVESGGGVTAKMSPPRLLPFRLPNPLGDTLGFPLPPNRLRVVDDGGHDVGVGQVGELWIKGPNVLEGYHGDDEATAAVMTPDGWLRSGDLVRRGPFGVVAFVGRAKDVIKSGGYSVYASEIERAMEEHPDVIEAAAVGLSDERLGEVPAVAVRVRDGSTVTEDDLLAWGRERLAAYKAPRAARIVESLPRTGTDKVAKPLLVALFAA